MPHPRDLLDLLLTGRPHSLAVAAAADLASLGAVSRSLAADRGFALLSAWEPRLLLAARGNPRRALIDLSLVERHQRARVLDRLNQGRDRITALNLHLVLVIAEDDLAACRNEAPDLWDWVQEKLPWPVAPTTEAVPTPLLLPDPPGSEVEWGPVAAALAGGEHRVTVPENSVDSPARSADLARALARARGEPVGWVALAGLDRLRVARWWADAGRPEVVVTWGGDPRAVPWPEGVRVVAVEPEGDLGEWPMPRAPGAWERRRT